MLIVKSKDAVDVFQRQIEDSLVEGDGMGKVVTNDSDVIHDFRPGHRRCHNIEHLSQHLQLCDCFVQVKKRLKDCLQRELFDRHCHGDTKSTKEP